MNFRHLLTVMGSGLLAAFLVQCGKQTSTGTSSGPSMMPMNNSRGAAITLTTAPPQPEDDPVSFANDIQPIFDEHCIDCHNSQLARGGLILTAGNSYDMLVNHPVSAPCMSDLQHDAVRVQPCDTPPCDPSQSQIWSKTMPDARAPDGTRCLAAMPFGGPGLGVVCPPLFSLLEQWIIDGAPNN